MRKNLWISMMAASMVLATSCTNEDLINPIEGDQVQVTFSVGVPEMETRTFSDGLTAKQLKYAVYAVGENDVLTYLDELDGQQPINLTTNVSLQLTTGKTYAVIFWAAAEDAPYTVDFAKKTMTVNYDNAVSNDENRDAFYKYHKFTVTGSQTEKVELRRPFAQLNIGTNDYTASANAGYKPEYSYVKVPAYSTLDLVNGTATGEAEREFKMAKIPENEIFPVTGYKYLAMNYLLVPADKETVDVTFGYGKNESTADRDRKVGSVPVQRNHRTNIYGQLLTSNVDVNVEIIPEYDESDYEADRLRLIAAVGGEITLEEDVVLTSPLQVNAGMVINLNGKTITNKADNEKTDVIIVNEGATLTINGDGKVEAVSGNDGFAVIAKGKVVINGGTYRSGLDKKQDGNCTVYATGKGEVYIHGGDFATPDGDDATLIINKKDADKNTTTIKIYGGTFKNFDPANNAAEGAGTNFVAEGYTSYKSGENEWTVVRGKAVTNAAEFISSFNNIKDGDVITLCADINFTTENRTESNGWYEGVYYIGDKSFTIDLGGNDITNENGAVNDYMFLFKNDGTKANTITIKNGSIDAGTNAYSAISTSTTNTAQLTINLENVRLTNNHPNGVTAKIRGGAILNVKNGTVITGKNSYSCMEIATSTVNIYDGAELYQNGTSSYVGSLVGVSGGGTANIYGGKGVSKKCGLAVYTTGGIINAMGGEWTANGTGIVPTPQGDNNLNVLLVQNNTTEKNWRAPSIMYVTGGTYKGGISAAGYTATSSAKLEISGGTFNANPSQYLKSGKNATESNGTWTVR